MFKSYKDKATESIYKGICPKGFPSNIAEVSRGKLRMLNFATILNDLRSPPGNRLELLVGNRKGQHSSRINDQFRICFVWLNGDVYDVEITAYHR